VSITRKEFFRQGFLSLGRTAFDIAGTIRGAEAIETDAASDEAPSGEPHPDMLATAFNERCLARNCGCFACVERCQAEAITVVSGEGIRIDENICTGCGTCEYVCPVNPKAVLLQSRIKPDLPPAMSADITHEKGE